MLYTKPVSDGEFRLNNPLKDIISVLRFPSISSPSLPSRPSFEHVATVSKVQDLGFSKSSQE